MCGIAGYFRLNKTRKNCNKTNTALRVLAREMESRGPHSWGITDGTTLTRAIGAISKTFAPPAKLPDNFVLHTRFATQGKIKESNSHPFVIRGELGVIVGVHNGIIDNHTQLNEKYNRNYRVDSQHIFGHIVNGLPLDDLDGYGTVVYQLNDEWFIGTFNGGDLAVSQTSAGVFFASTIRSLDLGLGVAALDKSARDVKTQDNAIYRVTDMGLELHQTITVGRMVQTKWSDYLDKDYSNWHENCVYCQDPLTLHNCSFLPEDTEGVCDDCMRFVADDSDDPDTPGKLDDSEYEVATLPDGAEYVCGCGNKVGEYEEIVRINNHYMCIDCFGGFTNAKS